MYIDELFDKINDAKGTDGSSKGDKMRAAFACAIIGAVAGLAIGYSRNANLFYSGLTGMFIGGAAGALFVPNTKK